MVVVNQWLLCQHAKIKWYILPLTQSIKWCKILRPHLNPLRIMIFQIFMILPLIKHICSEHLNLHCPYYFHIIQVIYMTLKHNQPSWTRTFHWWQQTLLACEQQHPSLECSVTPHLCNENQKRNLQKIVQGSFNLKDMQNLAQVCNSTDKTTPSFKSQLLYFCCHRCTFKGSSYCL